MVYAEWSKFEHLVAQQPYGLGRLSPEYEIMSYIFHRVIVRHNSYFSSLRLLLQSFEFRMTTPLMPEFKNSGQLSTLHRGRG